MTTVINRTALVAALVLLGLGLVSEGKAAEPSSPAAAPIDAR